MMGDSSCQTDSPNSSPALKNTRHRVLLRTFIAFMNVGWLTTSLFAQTEGPPKTEETAKLGWVESTALGIVEGITEYLPISSTGHLILTAHFLNMSDDTVLVNEKGEIVYLESPSPENPAGTPLTLKAGIDAYLIIIQFGAIAAVVLLYWERLLSIFDGFMGNPPDGLLILRNLILAFIPAAVIGLLLVDFIDRHLFGKGPVVIALFVGGIGILIVDRWHRKQNKG